MEALRFTFFPSTSASNSYPRRKMRALKSTASATTTTTTAVVVPESTATASSPSGAAAGGATIVQRSPWHSPVPYLFGGLAAMLGLIAFALLILACSYWKLSGQMGGGEEEGEGEEDGEETKKGKVAAAYEEQFVVILAGDDVPTCLAMRRANSAVFGCDGGGNGGHCGDGAGEDAKAAAKLGGENEQPSDVGDLHDHERAEPSSSSSS